jgi:signal transduction histidine kinase
VLDLSKIEAGRLELSLTDFSLSKLVGELSTMFAMRCKQKGIDWKVEWEVERAASPFQEGRVSSLLVQEEETEEGKDGRKGRNQRCAIT